MPGLRVRSGRIEEDEVTVVGGIPVTTPARTVLDLGCWYPTGQAVAAIDALVRATDLKAADVELLLQRYPGRRGIRQARTALGLVDAGAQSPKETWLRLLLMHAGLPRPQTQSVIDDEFGDVIAYLDMGWEEVKVAAEYDGDQHRTDRRRYARDQWRHRKLAAMGWIVVRVIAEDKPEDAVARVRNALLARGWRP